MVSYPVFIALFTLATAVGLVVGLYIFGDFRNLGKERMLAGLYNNWKFAVVLGLILLAIFIENKSNVWVTGFLGTDYTYQIYTLSFRGQVAEAVQNGLRSGFSDAFFIIIYLYSFTFVLFFTPMLYMIRNDTKRMKQYTLALAINYMILIPFYIFFAVRTTGMYELSGAEPILYSHENLRQIIMKVDPLDNAFPSGHVSVSVTIFLLLLPMRKHRQYSRFTIFMIVLSALTMISVLYLGIHWSIDVIGGVLLALFAVWLTRNKKFVRWLDKNIPKLLSKFRKRKLPGHK